MAFSTKPILGDRFARLLFEGDAPPVEMRPGDFIGIPARRRHRVEWTTPDEPTVWLAVHYGPTR
ncbi:MAG: cupin protein [Gemmataceae bacterium]|nr:cupin protein [Gemmataceae bacterium]